MTTDVQQIRVAYVGPAVLRVAADKAKLEIAVSNAARSDEITQKFSLTEARVDDVPQTVPVAVPAGSVIRFYKLPPDEAARLEKTRALVAAQQQAGKKGKGSLRVSADGCLEHATAEPLLISAYLFTVETGRFVPLFEKLNLRDVVKANRLTLAVCGE